MSVFLLTIFLVSFPSFVLAQTPKDSSSFGGVEPSLRKESERLFLEGLKLAQQEKFKQAVAKFLGSLRLLPNTKKSAYVRAVLHKYIGRAYHRQKNYLRARDYYLVHLRLLPNGKSRTKVKNWTRQVLQFLKATLQLNVKPEAACLVLYQGGRWKGKAPATIPIFAGKVSIRCEAEGYKPSKKSIKVAIGETSSTSMMLEPRIIKRIPPPRQVKPQKKKPAWVGLMIGGLGLAGVGAAGVVGGMALSDREQATVERDKNSQAGSTQALQLSSSANQKAFTANVLYISGGAVAVTGLVVYLVLRSQNTPRQATLSRTPSKARVRLLQVR